VDLQRFVDAQAPVIDAVMAELEAGEKRTHWMWFIFPQLKTLGRSSTAKYYGIDSVDEARAYLAQPVLGGRLKACARAVLTHHNKSANAIFGSPDDLKFRSSMTLFSIASPEEPLFRQALERFCQGLSDPLTVASCGSIDESASSRISPAGSNRPRSAKTRHKPAGSKADL
jgi:uncharacterized protein (DUF1810 family)